MKTTPATFCVALLLLGLSYLGCAAQGQASRGRAPSKPAPIGWDGRPVTRSCHAAVSDLNALKTTLIEHEKARIGFKNKIRHGVFSGGEFGGGAMRTVRPTVLLEKITRHLADLEGSGKTAALVYDVGMSERQYTLCVWLITRRSS